MGGEDRGACGFAWVTLWPEHKGNTKLGKAERRGFEALGARKDWTGKAWMVWNPSGYPVQNIDITSGHRGSRASTVEWDHSLDVARLPCFRWHRNVLD
jgi:hypothetical protein